MRECRADSLIGLRAPSQGPSDRSGVVEQYLEIKFGDALKLVRSGSGAEGKLDLDRIEP